jgi:hypothetical protein
MNGESNDRPKGASAPDAAKASNEPAATERQIQVFIDEHPVLSIAFAVAAGYAVGRIVSKL